MTQSRYRQIVRERVGAVAGRVGVAGQVEPHPRPALAVGRVVEEPVDGPLVGVRAPCRSANRSSSCGRRRQAAEVEARPGAAGCSGRPRARAAAPPSPAGRGSRSRCRCAARRVSATSGSGRPRGGINAQCSAYSAPCCDPARAGRRPRPALSRLPAFLGGMRSVSSSSVIRAIRSLESGSPGTIAVSPLFSGLIAASRRSSRKPLGPLRLVGAVAGEAVLRQDRPDLAVEVDRPGRSGFPAAGRGSPSAAIAPPVAATQMRAARNGHADEPLGQEPGATSISWFVSRPFGGRSQAGMWMGRRRRRARLYRIHCGLAGRGYSRGVGSTAAGSRRVASGESRWPRVASQPAAMARRAPARRLATPTAEP